MDWSIVINAGITFLFGGGVMMWVTLRDKKKQESEKTAQAHEQTRQDEVETDMKKFEYLVKRMEFAEQHIVTLHKKLTGMQNVLNEYVSRTIFAETHICLDEPCTRRLPAMGTFKPKCKRTKEDGTEVQA